MTDPAQAPTAAPAAPAFSLPFKLPSLAGLAALHAPIGALIAAMDGVAGSPVAMLFPQLKLITAAMPEIKAVHKFAGDLEAAAGDPGKMLAAVEANLGPMLAAAKGLVPGS